MQSRLSTGARSGRFAVQVGLLSLRSVRATVALAGIAALLVGVYGASYAAGGSHTVLPHLFYFAIVLAGVRFGASGAALTAACAGMLAGPLLPFSVSTDQMQAPGSWLLRMAVFAGVGLFVAHLAHRDQVSVRSTLHDARTSRALLRALAHGQVAVHYQPIRRTTDGQVVALEALARWTDPRRGPVPPDDFIPVAERTGVVSHVDRYVLRQAAAQVARWSEAHRPVTAAVNISATRFAQADLVQDVQEVLATTGLPPQQLSLEITETALISDVRQATEQIDQLRGLGVQVAIDDFGVGQASLSYVNDFAVTTVKIDGSFVSKALTDARTALLLAGLISLFGTLGLKVVAEGVSTAEELDRLRTLGCENVQGYHLGRPAPADLTEGLLQETGAPIAHG